MDMDETELASMDPEAVMQRPQPAQFLDPTLLAHMMVLEAQSMPTSSAIETPHVPPNQEAVHGLRHLLLSASGVIPERPASALGSQMAAQLLNRGSSSDGASMLGIISTDTASQLSVPQVHAIVSSMSQEQAVARHHAMPYNNQVDIGNSIGTTSAGIPDAMASSTAHMPTAAMSGMLAHAGGIAPHAVRAAADDPSIVANVARSFPELFPMFRAMFPDHGVLSNALPPTSQPASGHEAGLYTHPGTGLANQPESHAFTPDFPSLYSYMDVERKEE
ncbi:hypothetical protein CYMTET_21772 [Cymbomonas tetramitiformis]|uniref:Uncharacterized protein n=1 Tax=Cymbomonas tetramitiformis TaxID=36881 RepID=A0AAE0G1I0_9CHLO|nr:hypothetical protein CYMTET_21772 [Cymbomonas tetramitiformis]